MKHKVLILANHTDKHLGLFSDLEECENVILHYVLKKEIGLFLKVLRHIHLSRRFNIGGYRLNFSYIWFDGGDDICLDNVKTILVINGCLDKINLKRLERCKSAGIKLCLLILDSVDADSITVHNNRPLFFLPLWDRVYTFDPIDAKKYGFIYNGFHYYSKNKNVQMSEFPLYDVYFTGNTKGNRSALINGTFRLLSENGCKCIYDVQLKSQTEETCPGINYVENWVGYEEVLRRLSNCRCILEIVQQNQSGPSLRYFEAVFYNKKLITTNKYITSYPYYNTKWMKIIDTPDDVDIDWVKSEDTVDYQYRGEFSPVHFVEYLLEQ